MTTKKTTKKKPKTTESKPVAWTSYRFSHPLEKTLLDTGLKWYSAATVEDGNCGLDAITISALVLRQRSKATYEMLRKILAGLIEEDFNIPKERRVKEAAEIRKNGTWTEDDHLVKLAVQKLKVIPIIINGKYDPAALPKFESLSVAEQDRRLEQAARTFKLLPHQHAMFSGGETLVEEIAKLRRLDGENTKYIILKHVAGCHWISLARQSADSESYDTFFLEDELPPTLLKSFLTHISVSAGLKASK